MPAIALSVPFALLPVLVFVAELTVVTFSTIRIIFLSRGLKVLAAALGFFEVTIWLFAIGQVMQNLNNPTCFLGFAGGFTMGNYLGVIIERRLAIGTVVVQTITHQDSAHLVRHLREAGFGVTSVDAAGAHGPVKMVFTVVRRRDLKAVLAIVRQFDPEAFYSVDEVRESRPGLHPARNSILRLLPSFARPSRNAA